MSEQQIQIVTENIESAWKHLKMPKSRKKDFILIVSEYLIKSGMKENVCPNCLGSGFKLN